MTSQTTALLHLRSTEPDAHGWRILDDIAENGPRGMGETPGLAALYDCIASGAARFRRRHEPDLRFVEQTVNLDTFPECADHVEGKRVDELRAVHENRP